VGLRGLLQDWPLVEELSDLARGRRPETISPWTWHLLLLYQLQQAGYPFRASELSLETWLLLGLVHRVFQAAARVSEGRYYDQNS